jgi:hypothetical protein
MADIHFFLIAVPVGRFAFSATDLPAVKAHDLGVTGPIAKSAVFLKLFSTTCRAGVQGFTSAAIKL